jgi:hypothetical protein
MAETSNNPVDALLELVRSQMLDVNTCVPGVIVSYSGGKARVSPTVKKRFADGDVLDYPIIPNVRVCWPSFNGGQAGVKGPIKQGDKCLIVFAQQAVDNSDDLRMFDLQDAYAVMCDLGEAGAGDSRNNEDLTMFFGNAHVHITKAGAVNIVAPGGFNVVAPDVDIAASSSYTVTTPQATLNYGNENKNVTTSLIISEEIVTKVVRWRFWNSDSIGYPYP